MNDIFLSYASADKDKARLIAAALTAKGWKVWWDHFIPPGKTFDQVIEEALDSTRCVIVLWSKTSRDSDWVKTEAAEGKRRQILVPALIDGASIPLEFRRIQAARLSGWTGDAADPEFGLLCDSVRQVLGGGVPPVPKERNPLPRPGPPSEPPVVLSVTAAPETQLEAPAPPEKPSPESEAGKRPWGPSTGPLLAMLMVLSGIGFQSMAFMPSGGVTSYLIGAVVAACGLFLFHWSRGVVEHSLFTPLLAFIPIIGPLAGLAASFASGTATRNDEPATRGPVLLICAGVGLEYLSLAAFQYGNVGGAALVTSGVLLSAWGLFLFHRSKGHPWYYCLCGTLAAVVPICGPALGVGLKPRLGP